MPLCGLCERHADDAVVARSFPETTPSRVKLATDTSARRPASVVSLRSDPGPDSQSGACSASTVSQQARWQPPADKSVGALDRQQPATEPREGPCQPLTRRAPGSQLRRLAVGRPG